jgi:hypothetical protein
VCSSPLCFSSELDPALGGLLKIPEIESYPPAAAVLERLSNAVAGPNSNKAADCGKQESGYRNRIAAPQQWQHVADGRPDEETDPNEFPVHVW